jgi:outer membrane protein TolC
MQSMAQTQQPMPVSLQQAISMGVKNRRDLQASRYNIALANNTIEQNKKEWLPEINGSANIHYNTQLQATMIPAGFGGFTKPQLLALGAKNVTIAGLDLTQTVYNPALNTNIQLAQQDLALQQEKTRAQEIDIKQQISEAYLNVLLQQLQYDIAVHTEQRYKEYYELAEGKYQHGALIENEYLHARLDYQNAQLQTQQTQQAHQLAVNYLKYTINMPATANLQLTDSLGSPDIGNMSQLNNNNAQGRTEIKQLQYQQQLNQLEIKKTRQELLPSVSFFANYSQQFLNDKFNYMQKAWWAPFSYVGLKINVPISGVYKNRTAIKAGQLQALQTNLQLEQKTADINYEIQQTQTDLNNAYQNWQTTRNNYDLSVTIYNNQKQQYALGAFQYDQLLDTEKSLATAEQNYVKAVYEFFLAKLKYQKAVGAL